MSSDLTIIASSDFAASAEGWQSQVGYPTVTSTSAATWITKPPGFTTNAIVWSTPMHPGHDQQVFFRAPPAYTGDLSGCDGERFDFEMLLEIGAGAHPNSFYTGPQGLILESAVGDLWLPAPVRDTFDEPELGPAQRVSVTVQLTPECRLSTTGAAPTEQQFQAVLAAVTGLLVRVVWYVDVGSVKTALGAVTLYGTPSNGLDPKLEALEQRLQSAITSDSLTLDATVLENDGASIVSLMQDELGVASLGFSGHVSVTQDGDTLVLSADALGAPVVGASGVGPRAVFGVAPEGFTLLLSVGCGAGWSLAQTFPQLGASWAGTADFVSAADDDVLLWLSSEDLNSPSIARGLSLQAKASLSSGAAKAVLTLVTGASDPLPLLGPVTAVGDTEAYTLTATLPDFSVSIPVLPTLAFQSGYARFAAEFGGDGLEPLYAASIAAGAQVAVGSESLPLEVQIPSPLGGWRLGLAPGHAVGVGQVASFLGEFVGLSLATTLPDQIQALNTLQLRAFSVQLSADRGDFELLNLSLGAAPGEESASAWTIIPGAGNTPLLAVDDLGLDIVVRKQGTTTETSGAVYGSFDFSDALKLQVRVPLPIGSAPIIVTAWSTTPLPNLQDFARFLGGEQLAGLMPGSLGALTSFTLNELSFVYDPSANTLKRVGLSLAAAQPWTIIENQLEIQNVAIQGAVDDPLGSGSALTGRVGGTIPIGKSVQVDVQVSRSTAAASWVLDVVTQEVTLPSLGDLAELMGGDVASLLPETIRDSHFSLRDLELSVDLSQGKPTLFAFRLETEDSWSVISDVLVITEAGVSLRLDWSTGQRVATGSVFGNVNFCQAAFWLEAVKGADSWTLSAKLMEGEELTFEHVADAFVDGLWSKISAVGVPNLALKKANATYDTGSSDYSLSCEVGPASGAEWTLPLGITSISIQSLGAEVTCQRDAEGAATDKKVYVTGSFSLGESLQFDVKYLAGENLTIDCQLLGSDPVSVSTLVGKLCTPGASGVTWTAGFEALDKVTISNVAAQLIIGDTPGFQLTGTVTVDGTPVKSLFVIEKIKDSWEFALAISVAQDFTLGGFDSVLDAFKIDKATWMIAASSFDALDFSFPDSFPTPHITRIDRGLDFYGTFSIHDTYETFSSVTTVLPAGTVTGTELTVHGLLTDPLSKSYLEVILVASQEGVPLMGWDAVRLAEFSLRLTAEPAFALHGDFILKNIQNPDGSVLHVIIDLAISMTEVQIVFEQQPNQGAIFTWQDAFGIDALDVSLTDLALGITFEGPLFDGTIGGAVEFEHSDDPPNTVLPNAAPHPHIVTMMEELRLQRAVHAPELWGDHLDIDYSRAFDQDGIEVAMKVSFMIPAEEPVPVPYELAGRFHNFTLPYILHRFAHVDIPDVLMPIQFPDVEFDFKLPNPLKGGGDQDLEFTFNGDLVIFGIAGHIEAEFDETRIKFIANMQPITFEVGSTTILAITKSKHDSTHGPDLAIDSKPGAGESNIAGDFYCDFFDFIEFAGSVELKVDTTNPAKSQFHFSFSGHVGSLAKLVLNLAYQEARYMKVAGGFELALTTDNLPGFDHEGVEVASKIDLSKYQGSGGAGLVLAATLDITLDDTNPADPKFSMRVAGVAEMNLGEHCHPSLHIGVDIPVDKNAMSSIPSHIASEMATNTSQIFSAALELAECFVELLKIGVFVLEETAKVAGVLVTVFSTGVHAGASMLSSLGHAVGDVTDSLWNVFGSHDNKKNTNALKGAGYDSVAVAEAVKAVSDAAGHHYTAEDLVKDQAFAGYTAPHVAAGLCAAFTPYLQNPTGAGTLLARSDLTSFDTIQVASALRTQYASSTSTAVAMQALLVAIYTGGKALSAQQMANALAPLYPANEVAQVLRTHYASETATASAMAGLLVPAYQAAGNPLAVGDLAAALAPLYSASDVAPVLHADFGSDTDTATKLALVLQTAYAAVTPPLDASGMAKALATVFTKASDVVPALKQLYPADTDTAMKMAALLIAAYPSLDVAGMAAALHAGGYPAADIAQALEHYYPDAAGTPAKMATVFAAEGYSPKDVAPVLKTVFPGAAGTAAQMLTALQQGFGSGTIDASGMASALAAAPFSPVEISPALHATYASDTTTASAMSSLLVAAFADSQGNNTIAAATMTKALAAGPYPASGVGTSLIGTYPTETATALELSRLLGQAPYAVADVAPVLVANYGGSVGTAASLATVLAQTPFAAKDCAPVLHEQYPSETTDSAAMFGVLNGAFTNPALSVVDMAQALAAVPYPASDVSPTLKTHYPSDTATAESMYSVLSAAFVAPVLTATEMATALAVSPYAAVDVAPLLKTHYPDSAATAAGLAGLLRGAYSTPALELDSMLSALGASAFGAVEIAPAVKPLYSPPPTAQLMATGLQAALASSAPVAELQLGTALVASPYSAAEAAAGVKEAFPDTPAGLMAAILLLTGDTELTSALTQAAARKLAGDTAAVAAPQIVSAVSGLTANVLATALGAVFSPPNLSFATLTAATVAGYAQPDASKIAIGALVSFPTTTNADLFAELRTAISGLSDDAAAVAVAEARVFLGTPLSQVEFVQMIVQAAGAEADPDTAAAALVAAFGAATTPAKVIEALVLGFAGSAVIVDARVAAVATQKAFSLTPTQADQVLPQLVSTFSLTRIPNDVGSLALACNIATFSLNSTSAAMQAQFGQSWTPAAFQIVASVYAKAEWTTAASQRASGNAITTAAPAVYAVASCNAALMVQVLAAAYDLTQTSAAIAPMASALAAVKTTAGAKVYTLNEASAAMSAQYSPDWTPSDFSAFAKAFGAD